MENNKHITHQIENVKDGKVSFLFFFFKHVCNVYKMNSTTHETNSCEQSFNTFFLFTIFLQRCRLGWYFDVCLQVWFLSLSLIYNSNMILFSLFLYLSLSFCHSFLKLFFRVDFFLLLSMLLLPYVSILSF